MIYLAVFILLVAVLVFVGYPLARPAREPNTLEASPAESQRRQLLLERENALAALKDLELDRAIGTLARDDYEVLRAAQRHKAVTIMQEIDRVDVRPDDGSDDGAALEPAARLEAEIEAARRRLLAARGAACPSCGALLERGARACQNCKAALAERADER